MESDKKQIPFTENIFVYGIMVKEKSWRFYSDTKERNICNFKNLFSEIELMRNYILTFHTL